MPAAKVPNAQEELALGQAEALSHLISPSQKPWWQGLVLLI